MDFRGREFTKEEVEKYVRIQFFLIGALLIIIILLIMRC